MRCSTSGNARRSFRLNEPVLDGHTEERRVERLRDQSRADDGVDEGALGSSHVLRATQVGEHLLAQITAACSTVTPYRRFAAPGRSRYFGNLEGVDPYKKRCYLNGA